MRRRRRSYFRKRIVFVFVSFAFYRRISIPRCMSVCSQQLCDAIDPWYHPNAEVSTALFDSDRRSTVQWNNRVCTPISVAEISSQSLLEGVHCEYVAVFKHVGNLFQHRFFVLFRSEIGLVNAAFLVVSGEYFPRHLSQSNLQRTRKHWWCQLYFDGHHIYFVFRTHACRSNRRHAIAFASVAVCFAVTYVFDVDN